MECWWGDLAGWLDWLGVGQGGWRRDDKVRAHTRKRALPLSLSLSRPSEQQSAVQHNNTRREAGERGELGVKARPARALHWPPRPRSSPAAPISALCTHSCV